ncbi:hypothetical protein AAFF_G00365900 [Aldrovandia affinis]|uniref:SAM domain-containing protein n=1 Tax=Aldrovandia affinis TaxID=143900 RepID=A0AAD7WMN0_9TELE|nr:hypothetical protein AAFF_G00365900 [Aldrovandia affinis]
MATGTSGVSRRTNRPPPTVKSGESQETVVDSGIEELDSRSSSDHHLDNIMGVVGVRGQRGERGERGERGGGVERERGGDLLDSYMTYLDGQTFEMHNAKTVISTYPKSQKYREGGRAVSELRRQVSTAPPPSHHPHSFHSQRRRGEEEEGEEDEEENGQEGYDMRETQSLGRPTSLYFERPHTPEMKPLWGEGAGAGQVVVEGRSQVGGMYLEGRKLHPPISGMKASIINELNSKLQQMGNKGIEGWGGQRSLSRHSYPHLPPPSPSKPFATKPLPYWTKYDVADWLGYLNLGEHRERFLDNEIDGTHLPSLTKEDYLDLGVTRVGHRMNIERALKRLMDRLSSPFPVSALSPQNGRNGRRRDDGSRS